MLNFWSETLKNINQDPRKDPTFREMEIIDKENIEEEFLNFVRGKEIKKEIFFKIGKLFKNKEMM